MQTQTLGLACNERGWLTLWAYRAKAQGQNVVEESKVEKGRKKNYNLLMKKITVKTSAKTLHKTKKPSRWPEWLFSAFWVIMSAVLLGVLTVLLLSIFSKVV